jgi:hypothetical protein
MGGEQLPLWLKLPYTAFVCVLVPVYWVHYGPKNFLWFSDIALLATTAALWLESPLLASMMALAVAVPELGWNLDFLSRLLTGHHLLGLTRYMFDSRKPLYLRSLSLFHVALPAVLAWALHRLGYDSRAWAAQTVLALIVVPVTYWLTDPLDNVNLVYGPGTKPQTRIPSELYLAILMLFLPLVVYLPTHLVLLKLFVRP